MKGAKLLKMQKKIQNALEEMKSSLKIIVLRQREREEI